MTRRCCARGWLFDCAVTWPMLCVGWRPPLAGGPRSPLRLSSLRGGGGKTLCFVRFLVSSRCVFFPPTRAWAPQGCRAVYHQQRCGVCTGADEQRLSSSSLPSRPGRSLEMLDTLLRMVHAVCALPRAGPAVRTACTLVKRSARNRLASSALHPLCLALGGQYPKCSPRKPAAHIVVCARRTLSFPHPEA